MKNKAIFNTCPDAEFFGRALEIERLFERGCGIQRSAPGILLVGGRWTGKTELLRRVHQRLFWNQAVSAPVYCQIKNGLEAKNFAEDFLKETIRQYMAFLLREPALAVLEAPLNVLKRLVEDKAGGVEAGGLVTRHQEAKKEGDQVGMLRNALKAPALLGATSGVPVYLMIDDLDLLGGLQDPELSAVITAELAEAMRSERFSFAASTTVAAPLDGGLVNGYVENFRLGGLEEEEAVSMMIELARQHHVGTEADVLKLAARKLDGVPMYIKNLLWAAHSAGRDLMDLKDLAEVYANEMTVGNTAKALGSALRLGGLDELRALHGCLAGANQPGEREFADAEGLKPDGAAAGLKHLEAMGLVEESLGTVRWTGDNAAADYINYVFETRVRGRAPEEARTWLIRDILKEGFSLKGEEVRGRFKEEVAAVLKAFNGASVPKVLFSSRAFAAIEGQGRIVPAAGSDEIPLPSVAGCFGSEGWEKGETGPPILMAHGFVNERFDAGNEVAWIVCVKETATPVNLGDVENFIRRSSFLRTHFRAVRVIRWMVGREGFTEEAARRLETDGVFSSGPTALAVLKGALGERISPEEKRGPLSLTPGREFEVVLPMRSKAELVAARAAEEIGTEMGFDEEAIAQIKAALVEACINAFEHSRTRSSKVHLKFVATEDRLTINVQNGGADFNAAALTPRPPRPDGAPQKRGWGIELMKGLMDEVRFERIAEGTRIVLVKYLIRKGEPRDGKRS